MNDRIKTWEKERKTGRRDQIIKRKGTKEKKARKERRET